MKNESPLCCIFNVAPHYNGPIYKLMETHLLCDFYIGDKIELPIKLMNYDELKGLKKTLNNKFLFSHFYWQKGIFAVLFKKYKNYLMTAEVFSLSTWFLLIVLKFTGKKTYLWTHGWYGNEGFVKRIIKKLFFNLASGIFLYGEYAQRLMLKEGFSPSKLHVIYNSMDYDRQIKIRNQIKKSELYSQYFGNNNPVLLFVGRIQKIKKLDMILKSMKKLDDKNIHFNMIFIGKEVEETGLSDLVNELELSNRVWFYGSCFDEEILGELIGNADICVSPGNVGLTAIHALMYGTPVITHDNFCKQMPEFEAIIPGRTGLFFKENDLTSMIAALEKWMLEMFDKRAFVRQEAYKVIDEKYNSHKQIKLLKDVIYPIIE